MTLVIYIFHNTYPDNEKGQKSATCGTCLLPDKFNYKLDQKAGVPNNIENVILQILPVPNRSHDIEGIRFLIN